MNRAERRRIERENKSKISYQEQMINWVKSLNDAQKGAINAVIDEQIKDSNKFLYEIVKAALNISTDYTEDEIN